MWKPITEGEMRTRIELDIPRLPNEARRLFGSVSVPLTNADCRRADKGKTEYLYVIAEAAKQLLVYDDVEDEYGIAVRPLNGPILDWTLYGELEIALKALCDGLPKE